MRRCEGARTAFDPTHNTLAGERYIALAGGRDYDEAAPTRGVFRGGPAGLLSVFLRIEQDEGPVSSGEMRFASPSASPAPVAPAPADQ